MSNSWGCPASVCAVRAYQLAAICGGGIASLILLAWQGNVVFAIVACYGADGPIVIVVGLPPAGGDNHSRDGLFVQGRCS